MQGYQIYRSDRGRFKKRNIGSGGVCIVFKSHLNRGISKLGSRNKDIIWVKLDKSFFQLTEDVYLCNAYIPPEYSDLHKEPDLDYWKTLDDEIAQYSSIGHILIAGDLNSRTSDLLEKYHLVEEDTLISDHSSINCRLDLEKIHSIVNKEGKRVNEDKVVNPFGKNLISLVEKSSLVIANGRTLGD